MDFNNLKVIRNSEVFEFSEISIPIDCVYEVVKFTDNSLLFFDEHIFRLKKSLELNGKNLQITREEILKEVYLLIRVNGLLKSNISIKIDIKNDDIYTFYSLPVKTNSDLYKNGAECKSVNFERLNPNSKSFNLEIKTLREELKKDDCYEYLLLDKDNNFGEGIKSNLFFFRENVVYTADSKSVLSGITRLKIIDILGDITKLEFRNINYSELNDMDGAFLSGTSPGVLPISRIDNTIFDLSKYHICNRIKDEYERLVSDNYLKNKELIESFFYDECFKRTISLLGRDNFNLLRKSNVLCVGLGGVGGSCTEAILRSGVSNLIICDGDIVDISNLNRQIIANQDSIGKKKALVMKEKLLGINPFARIECLDFFLTVQNVRLLDKYNIDYIVDAIDSFEDKLALIKYAKDKEIPIISSMGTGGKLNPAEFNVSKLSKTSYCPLAKKLRKRVKEEGIGDLKVVYSEEKSKADVKNDGYVSSVSFSPPVCGYILASEVIKDITSV